MVGDQETSGGAEIDEESLNWGEGAPDSRASSSQHEPNSLLNSAIDSRRFISFPRLL